MMSTTEKMISATKKVISAIEKVITASEEVITASEQAMSLLALNSWPNTDQPSALNSRHHFLRDCGDMSYHGNH